MLMLDERCDYGQVRSTLAAVVTPRARAASDIDAKRPEPDSAAASIVLCSKAFGGSRGRDSRDGQ